MRSRILRIAAGMLALIGVPVACLMMVFDRDWRTKVAALSIMCVFLRFAVYAARWDKSSREEKLTPKQVAGLLLGGILLGLVGYLGRMWFGGWFIPAMAAFLFVVSTMLFFVVLRRKKKLAHELSGLDRSARLRVLSILEPSHRDDVLRITSDTEKRSNQ